MNKYVVIIALINGMIGGLILVLPILAMNGGSVLSLIVILATGFFSFYSCYLCIIHLGSCTDLDKALLQHFNQSKFVSIFYNFLVFFGMVLLLMLYFNLIVTQWRGLVPYDIANPICNAVALVALTFALNYFHFGAKLLGYGIISIIGYCIFLVWLISTAPSGPNTIPKFGTGAVNLAASMGQAFSIQGFFIPVLRQLPETKQYVRYVLIAYLIGGSVYLYIAYAGSFGIINRQTVPPGITPQTIQNYFHQDQIQVGIVQVIYLIHLYSAYGQFLLICKKRFFGIFGIQQSKQGTILNIPEIIFILIVIGITVGIFFGNVGINVLIQINGAILGFFFIYLLPALMHFVCLYYPGRKQITITMDMNVVPESTYKQYKYRQGNRVQFIEMSQRMKSSAPQISQPLSSLQKSSQTEQKSKQSHYSKIQKNSNQPSNIPFPTSAYDSNNIYAGGNANNGLLLQNVPVAGVNNYVSCGCRKSSPLFQVLDLISMLGMVGLGAFIMVDGFISVITGK